VQYTCSVLGPLEAHRLVTGLHTRSLDPVLLHKFVELSQQAPAAVARAATCITLSRCKQRAASVKQDNACVMTTSNGQVLGSSLLGSLLAVLLQETSRATAIVKPACTHVCPGARAAQQQLQCSLYRGRIASVKGEKQLEHATGAGMNAQIRRAVTRAHARTPVQQNALATALPCHDSLLPTHETKCVLVPVTHNRCLGPDYCPG
jgi:hypothetical protein